MIINGVIPRPDIALGILQEASMVDQYVAHLIFPTFEVAVSTGTVPSVLRRREIYRIFKPKGGAYPRVTPVAGNTPTFNCVDAGLEEPLDSKDVEIYGSLNDAVQVTAIGLTEDVLRARDATLAAVLFNTTTFAGYTNAFQFAVGNASSKLVDDVSDAVEKVRLGCGAAANRIVFSGGMLAKVRKDPQVQARYRAIAGYTEKAGGINLQLRLADLAAVFGVEEVIVAGGVKDTADEGQTRTKSSVWADTFMLVYYQPPLGQRWGQYLGRTMAYNTGLVTPRSTSGIIDSLRGLEIEEYDDSGTNTHNVRARQMIDLLLTNISSGYLLSGG